MIDPTKGAVTPFFNGVGPVVGDYPDVPASGSGSPWSRH